MKALIRLVSYNKYNRKISQDHRQSAFPSPICHFVHFSIIKYTFNVNKTFCLILKSVYKVSVKYIGF